MNRINIFNRIFPLLNLLSPLIDVIIGVYIYNSFTDERELFNYVGLAYVIFIIYRFIKGMFKISGSKSRARNYLSDNRVIAIDGPQGRGKTSLSGYFAMCSDGDVFTNVPMKIRGKYTYKLTTEMLSCQDQLTQYSFVHVDECNLFYSNLEGKKGYSSLEFGQSCLAQCIRHFTDGNIIYSSTDVFRLPKLVRDNFSSHLQVLSQESYQFSYVGAAILKIISKLFKVKKCFTGIRLWTAQHFEKISEDGYTYDLSTNTSEDKERRYANMLQFAVLQSPNTFIYDDRYMYAFYKKLNIPDYKRWKQLALDLEDFSLLYDSKILEYFSTVYHAQVLKTQAQSSASAADDSDVGTNIVRD